MKCHTVRSKLAGYLDDAIMGAAQAAERARVREHLEGCGFCREELERYRKLPALLAQVPRNGPPVDLAGGIRFAAAPSGPTQEFPARLERVRDRAGLWLASRLHAVTVP